MKTHIETPIENRVYLEKARWFIWNPAGNPTIYVQI